jgi:hypothetical protein
MGPINRHCQFLVVVGWLAQPKLRSPAFALQAAAGQAAKAGGPAWI